MPCPKCGSEWEGIGPVGGTCPAHGFVSRRELDAAFATCQIGSAAEDGAALLEDMAAFVRRYVVLTVEQADAIALWAVHTHAFDAADMTPYLQATSAEKQSGKTLLLEVLDMIVARPWFTGRVTAAALVRKVDAYSPTLLLDESDAAFKGGQEYGETLRGVLNSGYRRGGKYSVCVGQGGNLRTHDFATFCPKAIAGIGSVPDTVADRSIRIEMKRKGRGESVDRFRRRVVMPPAATLRERMAGWAAARLEALRDAEPDLPGALDDRAADVWEPLLAIADRAGGDWPGRARGAALALSTGDAREDESLGIRLLRDIRAIFEDRAADRIFSNELVSALVAIEESPWGDLRGRPLDASKLAGRLKPFGVAPQQVRIGEQTRKGYRREDFADAWERYIPVGRETPETGETSCPPELKLAGKSVSDVSDVSPNAEPSAPCPHRPPAEGRALWLIDADTWGGCPAVCACCGAPVRDGLYDDTNGLCPSCRLGVPVPSRGGHVVRLALDLGGRLIESGELAAGKVR